MNEEFHAPILPLARYRLRFRPVAGAGSLDALRGQYLGSAWRQRDHKRKSGKAQSYNRYKNQSGHKHIVNLSPCLAAQTQNVLAFSSKWTNIFFNFFHHNSILFFQSAIAWLMRSMSRHMIRSAARQACQRFRWLAVPCGLPWHGAGGDVDLRWFQTFGQRPVSGFIGPQAWFG